MESTHYTPGTSYNLSPINKKKKDQKMHKFDTLKTYMIAGWSVVHSEAWYDDVLSHDVSECECSLIYVWQSRVEIKGYSVTYFNRIAAFKAPYCWTSVKGGAHLHFVDSLDIHASTKHIWTPPLTEVQQYGASNTVMRSKYATE